VKAACLSLCLFLIGSVASADDWPHVNGLRHDRNSTEAIKIDWETKSPTLNWRIACNGGFSSFVVGEGKALTVLMGEIKGEVREVVVALDRKTGKPLWNAILGKAGYDRGGGSGTAKNSGGDGPRATPVIDNGKVFVYGGMFDLYCLDAETGKLIWSQDILNDYKGRMIKWQNAMSPLVFEDRVLVSGGGKRQAFLAFNKEDGALLWKSGQGTICHATPAKATISGVEQALFVVRSELVSLDPETGDELWTYPFKVANSMAASPSIWKNLIHVTAGYGTGGASIEVTKTGDKWKVDELWRKRGNRDVASHWSTPVAHEGYLYGFYSYKEYGTGAFKCIDMKTGKIKWREKGFGQGQVIMADNKLFALTDFGRLNVIEPDPAKYSEIAVAELIEGKCWATPAFSDGQLFLRSTKAGVCVDL
jgi:outer membrane protein assembly factor BamB